MWSSIRVPCVNIRHLASSTLDRPRLLLYMITFQRSRRSICKESMVKRVGSSEKAITVSGYTSHAARVVFFPMPINDDEVSQPV